jgi:coenzyme F420-reducing hydrogenase delta subunit
MDGKMPPKVVVFTCNWNAYSGMERAGDSRLPYPATVRPIRVGCLGELSVGAILKAFEKGAEGVLLLGCPPGECHYGFGSRGAEDIFADAKSLVRLLGCRDEQLVLDWVAAGEDEVFVEKIRRFVAVLNGVDAE